MDLNKKLEELKPYQLNCNVFDVYSYNGLTMQDLLCQFFTKINECITVSNKTIDLADWLVNEGLQLEVVKKLMLWLEDGTLEDIINVNVFETLNNKIKVIEKNSYVNINDFNLFLDGVNDDTKNLQNAFDYAIKNKLRLVLPPNSKIKLTNTVYLLNQSEFGKSCEIDLNYADIIVDNDFLIFDSGKKLCDGDYISVYKDSLDSSMSFGFVFGNFKVTSNITRDNYVIRIKDFHQGCKIHSIHDRSNKVLCSKNSYYCEFENLNNISEETTEGAKYLFESIHNLCKISKLIGANTDVIYEFRGNCAGVDFNNNSLEGANIAVLFSGYAWNFNINNCYSENIKQSIVKVTNEYGCKLSIQNNFIQFKTSDTSNYIIETIKNDGAKYDIDFDSSNKILDMSTDRVFKGGSYNSQMNITLPYVKLSVANPGVNDIYSIKKDEYVYGANSDVRQLFYNKNIKAKAVVGLNEGIYAGSFTNGYSSAGIKGCQFPIMSDDNKTMTIWTAMTNIDTCLIYVNLKVMTHLGTDYIRGLFMGNTFIGEKPDHLNIEASGDVNIKIVITDTRENGGLGEWSFGEIRLV